MATDLDEELPTATLPKLTEAGLRERTAAAGADAIAVSPTDRGELVALLVIVRVPEMEPVAWGSSVTLIGRLCPGAMVVGSDMPETANPDPLTLTWEIVTAVPLTAAVTVFVEVVPTVVLPNARVVESTVS